MNSSKEAALREWFNIFGVEVGIDPVERLTEFPQSRHLSSVLRFMETKKKPSEPAPPTNRNLFLALRSHLEGLQRHSPNKFFADLLPEDANFGTRLEIAKFLLVVLHEVRMDPELNEVACDVVVSNLGEMSRKELEIIMDYMDDKTKWKEGEWDRILFEGDDDNDTVVLTGSNENTPRRQLFATPKTPRSWRRPLRERNRSSEITFSSKSLRDSSLLDSPQLRTNRISRIAQEKESEVKELKAQLTESRFLLEELLMEKKKLAGELKALGAQNEKLQEAVRVNGLEYQNENERLRGEVEGLKTDKERLVEENRTHQMVMKEKRTTGEQLRDSLLEREDEILALEAQNEELKAALNEEKQQKKALEEAFEEIKEEFCEKILELEDELEAQRTLFEKLKEEGAWEREERERIRSELQEQILEAEEQFRTRELEGESLRDQVLRTSNADYITRIHDLESRLSMSTNFRESARRSTMEFGMRFGKLESEKLHLKSEVQRLEKSLEETEKWALEREETVRTLGAEILKLNSELSDAQIALFGFEEVKKRKETLETQQIENQLRWRELKDRLDETTDLLRKREEEIANLNRELFEAQRTLRTAQNENLLNEEMRKQFAGMQDKQILDAVRVKGAENEADLAKEELQKLKRELNEVRCSQMGLEERVERFQPAKSFFDNYQGGFLDMGSEIVHIGENMHSQNTIYGDDEDILVESRSTVEGMPQSRFIKASHVPENNENLDPYWKDNISRLSDIYRRISMGHRRNALSMTPRLDISKSSESVQNSPVVVGGLDKKPKKGVRGILTRKNKLTSSVHRKVQTPKSNGKAKEN
ncbi:hypothetical protein QR680_004932 [Steinernema hermaphroditum]|uniref:Uncharacterized protein n=1 Tax=Steinernema hermaphroditum TaxID=289476 RepID=A0AA39HSI0_9BILA|nr:hypothetical protein QR680_004932 [Steinernema hermaphroditum]